MTGTRSFCSFLVDGMCFGIEVHKVQEVIRFQELTHVPLAPPMVGGLMNLRGKIVAAIDLRRRLRLPDRPHGSRPMNVVVRGEEGTVSLLVDEICGVVEASDEQFEQPPAMFDADAQSLVEGTYTLDNCLLLVLNTAAATQITPL